MDVVARVIVLDLDGQPKDIPLQLEGYDLRAKAWRGLEDILKAIRISPQISRSGGRYEISFTLKDAAFLDLFSANAFFRLVSPSSGPEGGAASVLVAGTSMSGNADRFEVDFGTVLFLGKEHGFYTAHNKDGVFCSGLSLASDDAEFAAAQRRFYANPYEAAKAVADRDRMRDQIGKLEAANAALERSLTQSQTERASLTQENSGLKEKFAAASQSLAACAEERDRLTKQLAACVSERQAATAQIETLQRQLTAAATELRQVMEARQKAEADLASCGERVRSLEQQLKESAAALDACVRARAEIEKRAVAAERERDALQAASAALEGSLAQCQTARASLTQENSGLNEKFAAASRDLAACAEERNRLTKQLAASVSEGQAATTQIETLRRQLTTAATELRQVIEARQKAEADLASCGERVRSLEQQLKESAAALDACAQARAEIDKRAAAAERERDALEDRVRTLTEERRLLAAELEALRRQTSDQAGFVEGLRTELVTEKATAVAATQKLESIRAQMRSEVPAEAVFTNLGKSLGDATRQLAIDNIPYRIGRTSFTLKTFVGDGGLKLFLPDAAHSADNPAVSEVSVELIPDESIAPGEGAMTVPDVLGLTETAAIRVLASLSLKAEKAVETVANQPEKHGRALRQIPKAGVQAAKGDTILVIYGAEKGNQSGQ